MVFFLIDEPIFIADKTIDKYIKEKDKSLMKLLDYQLNRIDTHNKIYLPPSIIKKFKDDNKDKTEDRAGIHTIFASAIPDDSTTLKVFQEVCLTAEWLRDVTSGAKIVFITDNKKFHNEDYEDALKKDYGVLAVLYFRDIEEYVKDLLVNPQ